MSDLKSLETLLYATEIDVTISCGRCSFREVLIGDHMMEYLACAISCGWSGYQRSRDGVKIALCPTCSRTLGVDATQKKGD